MSFTLVTNDDGVDALSLPSLARALASRGPVKVAAPAVERSWIGKAISRFDEIIVDEEERDGVPMKAVHGYPADAAQLGIYQLFGAMPDLVVSGVNVGANVGSAFSIGSGTVGAAIEASIAGIPAFAFSVVAGGPFSAWADHMRSPAALPAWERYAAVSAAVVAEVLNVGFPIGVDVISVNFPDTVEINTPRRVTHLARTRYGSLFQGTKSGYRHDWKADTACVEGMEGSDIEAVEQGVISVTPMRAAAIGVASPTLSELYG